MPKSFLSEEHIKSFQDDGVVLIKGLFADYVELIQTGIDYNIQNPGRYAAENIKDGEGGRFFDDYCNWNRISQFQEVIKNSKVAEVAAILVFKTKSEYELYWEGLSRGFRKHFVPTMQKAYAALV